MSTPWRLVAAQVIRAASAWGRASNDRAIDHARGAAVQASRAAVERAEVRLWLASDHTGDHTGTPAVEPPAEQGRGAGRRPPYVAAR